MQQFLEFFRTIVSEGFNRQTAALMISEEGADFLSVQNSFDRVILHAVADHDRDAVVQCPSSCFHLGI